MKIERGANEKIVIETEIGCIMGVDFSFAIPTDTHARDAVASIVPMVELPRTYESPGGATDPRDLVSANLGCARYIVGQRLSPGAAEPKHWKVSLRRDGQLLHETTGEPAEGGQWHELRAGLYEAAQGRRVP